MRRIVSVSLGSPSRDWQADLTELGVPLTLERRGVGASYEKYTAALAELDHDESVAAIGIGGINRYLFSGARRYPIRKAEEMASVVHHKPACDGAGLKQHWEPYVVRRMSESGILPIRGRRVLMVCAVDRWGMLEALHDAAAELAVGDLMFGLGVPIPLRSWSGVQRLTRALLPIMTQYVPFEWLYPTGESKDVPKYRKWYDWAEVIAGDYKFIAKHMPAEAGSMKGKAILTNTTTPKDVEALRGRGVELLITTTPSLHGRSFGTNVIEATAVSLTEQGSPDTMALDDYLSVFRRLGWDQPRVERLQERAPESA